MRIGRRAWRYPAEKPKLRVQQACATRRSRAASEPDLVEAGVRTPIAAEAVLQLIGADDFLVDGCDVLRLVEAGDQYAET
jgi:hypothetical protein